MASKLWIIVGVMFGTSCASFSTESSRNYSEPEKIQIENSAIIDQPFDRAWDDLVEGLAKTFYVINNIDKESRLLNVSFEVSDLEKYVDCGETARTYSFQDYYQEWVYGIGDQVTYRIEGIPQTQLQTGTYYEVSNRPKLQGRANVYVAPHTDNRSKIEVNARYILTLDRTITERFALNNVARGSDSHSIMISFNTNEQGKSEELGIICYATGEFERDILSAVVD